MEKQDFVEYECSDNVTDHHLVTESREEAMAYFEEKWVVVERQITVCKPSMHTQSRLVVLMTWNNNPEFEGV